MGLREIVHLVYNLLGEDIVLLIESLFTSTICCYILSKIPRNGSKTPYLFCIITSVPIFARCFGVVALLEYVTLNFIMFFILRRYRKSIWCPLFTTAIVMTILLTKHLCGQVIYQDQKAFEFTTLLMIYTIKFSSFSWSLYDGRKLLSKSKLPERFEDRAIKTMPGLLDYYAYLLFPGGLMVGPLVHYSVYDKYMRSKPPYDRVPSIIRPLLNDILLSAVFISVFILAKIKSFSAFYALSDSFAELVFTKKCLAILLMSFTERAKYHAAWFISHISLVVSGIDYKGNDPKTKKDYWGATRNLDTRKVEFPLNPKEFLDGWNMGASDWLKNCIYLRLITEANVPHYIANVLTSSISALWHGFLPGYYVCFTSAALLTISAKMLRKLFRPFFLEPSPLASMKFIYDIAGYILTYFFVSYISLVFVVGTTLRNSYEYLLSVKFIGHILCVMFILVFNFKPLVRIVKDAQNRLMVTPTQTSTNFEVPNPKVPSPKVPKASVTRSRHKVPSTIDYVKNKSSYELSVIS